MNCQKVYSKLLVLSRSELELPANIELVQHLHNCPFCNVFREIWVKVEQDIERGFKFTPPDDYWDNFMSGSTMKSKVNARSVFRSLLWKLDWMLYPEKSLKWALAFCLVVSLTFGGVKLQQFQSVPIPGLPNQLELNRFLGNTNVLETLENGISFSRQTLPEIINSNKVNPTDRSES